MPKFSFSAPLLDMLHWRKKSVPTIGEVRRMYAPPQTLGAPESVRMAMDSAFDATGGYSLLQHSLALGQYGALASFMGYGALQNIAQNGLVRACIETVADDMTRAWIELTREGAYGDDATGNGDMSVSELSPFPDSTQPQAIQNDAHIEELTAEIKRLELQRVIHEAACMTGYYGGCLLFLDTGVAGDSLADPLNLVPKVSRETKGRGFLKGIRVIDPVNVFPGEYNSINPLAADYYMPSSWWILGRKVHASRVIRVVCNEAPLLFRPAYNFLGIPQAQILWDYIVHFQENRDSENRLLNKFSTFVFKTALGDIINGSATDLAQLDARMQILAHNRSNDGVLAIDKDAEDVVKVETPLSGVADIVRQSLEILAAMNRTPAVKLLGISPSGFNATGESDIRNYYDHIRSQQEKVIRSPLKTILDVAQISLWGKLDKGITFNFCPLSVEDENAVAMTQQVKINSLCALLDRNVISVEEARKVLVNDPNSGVDDLDPEATPEPVGMGDFDGGGTTAEGMEAEELDTEHLLTRV